MNWQGRRWKCRKAFRHRWRRAAGRTKGQLEGELKVARVEYCYPLKWHLVLGCVLLVQGMTEKADVGACLGEYVDLATPDGQIYPVQILELNVQSTFSGNLQVLIGIDAPAGLPDVPRGTIVYMASSGRQS